ncbi:phycobiliprotein lyase [Leptolyngbya boryana CZ1]|uniref:Chromophore lyase CpcS/CpeS n=1 Tax=Leptolyngbya boryana CZ1 TaxID=3060204 RepID=A0AA97APB0_LEPBY|nr:MULTISPECIES: phycobiliprotein lyase [Leptolyngbya]MBD1854359.1 phycobiliprotein lyase [Leptolyngbya sp. FACHB-1624]MBN8562279.1 phycobiliprotein lyase [Leptolyngbya sp. UWPOB_LEPTO1]WNZ45637.1 phycobiliprotein lyase [Leptolyngbya boryana CZ1]
MDIVEFFELSAGRWSSMRTSHHPAAQQGSGKSTIEIDLLDKSDPAVIQLCEKYQVDPTTALLGARLTWEGFLDGETRKQTGSTVLVPIAGDTQNSGKLLGEMGTTQQTPIVGHYEVSDAMGLTLITESDTLYSKERIWFESPNVRFRHSVLKQAGGFSLASFCSEVRLGAVKPDPKTADATATK